MAEKRGSLFTVRDVESAVVTYTVLGFLYIVGICLYEFVTGWNGVLQMLMRLEATFSVFNQTAIAFIVFKEGVDIMLRRFNEWRVEHAQSLAKAKEQGIEQGRTEAYQAIAAWNSRRLEAEAKGIPFNEPPPSQNGDQHQ